MLTTKNTVLISLLGFSSLFAPQTTVLAQSTHGSHHHLMIGRDNRQTLDRGSYAGLPNPNYNRLSLLFPHQHEPVSTSGFHAIGAYSYTGTGSGIATVPTSTNNRLPEISARLSPLPLFPDNGVFTGKWVSQATEQNIYSDLKIKPLKHLLEDINDPFVAAIYNAGNGRWNSLLGDEATIALELISITPGLQVADEQGNDLFDQGNTEFIGQGDDFTFTPKFYVDDTAPSTIYSATFRFVDTNDSNGRTPFLPSGTFSFDFQQATIPEPSTLFGLGIVGILSLCSASRKKEL